MYRPTSIKLQSAAPRLTLWGYFYRGVVKNVLDSFLALFALIILSPLLLLISIRIKQDSPGPILIKQKCEGLKGHPFKMYKFRTHQIVATGSAHNPKYVLQETYIGKILKEANLENLPQLFSVFIGDMSLVGPRPNPLNMTFDNMDVNQIVPEYQIRNLVKPGMTGWARINGLRGPLRSFGEAAHRASFDIDYTKHASFRFDWLIILKTLPLLKPA